MNKMIENYVELICKSGVNIQKGQPVYITSNIETYDFALKITKRLYELGASDVYVNWISDDFKKLDLNNKSEQSLKHVEEWIINRQKYYIENNAIFLTLVSKDPEGLKGIDPDKLAISTSAMLKALKPYKIKLMNDENTWCTFAVPSLKWAQKVFPNSKDPINDLWIAILKATKCDMKDPIEQWQKHLEQIQNRCKKLTECNFDKLVFTNDIGTNLEVALVKNHLWEGGKGINKSLGNSFIPNIPTEEVFTMPSKYNVNGKVCATKPLNYNGNLIEDFWVEFKDGKAIKWDAKVGCEALSNLINTDAGSAYLGEVALVDDTNPISQQNLLFYTTLIDENASCHLAFGNSYPTTIKNIDSLTIEEKEKIGINESIVHVDFMFGNNTMKVIGVSDKDEVVIMENGVFII